MVRSLVSPNTIAAATTSVVFMQICLGYMVCFALAVLLTGCGTTASNQPPLMPVSGTVTLDGKPISGVAISFIPIGATHSTGASGYTDNAGRYKIMATRGGTGTPVGEYRVVAIKWVMPDGSDFPTNSKVGPMNIKSPAKQVLPAKYSAWDQPILKATVRDGANTIDFLLFSKP